MRFALLYFYKYNDITFYKMKENYVNISNFKLYIIHGLLHNTITYIFSWAFLTLIYKILL